MYPLSTTYPFMFCSPFVFVLEILSHRIWVIFWTLNYNFNYKFDLFAIISFSF